MGVELNTGNLRYLCRICLGEGDYNLWEHKVSWNNSAFVSGAGDEDSQELTVHEVLQMYNDCEHSILELENELQLICKVCLDELQPHFQYYKRLQAANKQMKQLYEQALEKEQDKATTMKEQPTIIEHIVYGNNCTEYLDFVAENPKPEQQITALLQEEKQQITAEPIEQVLYADNVNKDQLSTQIGTKFAQKRKYAKNPKFILTGGVTQLLAHANKSIANYSTILNDERELSETNFPCSPQKRKRTDDVEGDVQLLLVNEQIMHDFYREDDAASDDVVAEESATTLCASRYEQQEDYEIVQEFIQECPPNEILTIGDEYAVTAESDFTDELPKVKNVEESQQYNKGTRKRHETRRGQTGNTMERQVANGEENAVLPYSTLKTDSSGRSLYICKYCPQAFTASCFLITHARSAHVCKYCSKGFVKTPDLFAHIKEAHNEHKCGICDKEFSSNSNLRAHMKRLHIFKSSAESTYSTTTKSERRGAVRDRDVYIDESNEIMPAEYLD